MRVVRRIVLEETVIGFAFITVAWYAYYVVAVWGMGDYVADGTLQSYVTGPGIHVEILLSAAGFSLLIALVNRLSDVPAIRQRPVGQIIMVKAALYAAGLVVVIAAIHLVFVLFLFSPEEIRVLWGAMSPRLMASLFFFVALSFVALAFLLEVRRKIGPGNLWALLTGRYHRPREEDRVFLFLDLKGSTTIAERLGHARYSQFIRNCYHDLTEPVLLFQAEVYQFVGDEVVLTWRRSGDEAVGNSLATFFAFQARLAEREAWYRREYGVAPEFRAGLETGSVTATEVGDIKREIAFHGDALNTAARLLELCGELDVSILVSGKIHERIAQEPGLLTEPRGEMTLRGKEKPVSVYGVEQAVA